MMKPTTPRRLPPLRDRTIALLAARGAYVRALRRSLAAAEHLALSAAECHRDPGAARLRAVANTQSRALGLLLDDAE
jgi:hypothetical protein